ncbi:MAG TPA: hypothetical protein VGJ63_01880 [Micromonosporaceae bacterium]|jgi:hypothetical protein
MPEQHDVVTERVRAAATGLAPMVARAEAVWRERAGPEAVVRAPDWEQVFPSQFYEFTNRR